MTQLQQIKEAISSINTNDKALTDYKVHLTNLNSKKEKIISEIISISPTYFSYNERRDNYSQEIISLDDYIKHLESNLEELEVNDYKLTLIETLKGLNSYYSSKLEVIYNEIEDLKEKIKEIEKQRYNTYKLFYNENIFQLFTISKKGITFSKEEIDFLKQFEFFHEDKKRFYILSNRDVKAEVSDISNNLKSRISKAYLLKSRFLDRLFIVMN